MIPAPILDPLRCPVCRDRLLAATGGLRCPAGHAFDVARQGYVNLLHGRNAGTGDSAEMVAARAGFLAAGHFAPLAEALAGIAVEAAAPDGLVVEVGAGTGYYLARILDRMPGHFGLALDLSKYAARRAAKAHPRAAAAVADAWQPMPLADSSSSLVLDVFAPRNAPEFHRVLRADGALVLVTPTREHLAELRAALGLIEVDPEKDRRLGATLGGRFRRTEPRPCRWTLNLERASAATLVAMGPSARHIDPAALAARVAALPEPVAVTASVHIEVCRPI